MNKINGDIPRAAKIRLNRIANNGNNRNQEVAKRLLKTFTNEELATVVQILTPLAGLQTSLFRATSQIYFANQKNRRAFTKTMRGLMTDSLNIFKLSRKSKELFIHGIVNGTITDDRRKITGEETEDEKRELSKFNPSPFYYIWTLMRERVYLNKKGNTLSFVMYDELLKHLDNVNAGDPYKNIIKDNKIDRKSKEYIKDVLKYARWHSDNIIRLIDAQIHEKCDFSNTPVAMYGFLSSYLPDINEGEIPYNVLYAKVIYDLLTFTDANKNELRDLLQPNCILEMIMNTKN